MSKTILKLKVKKLNNLAVIPEKAHAADAGFDLVSTKKEIITSNSVKAISTGIAISVPKGYYGQIHDRSGFSLRTSLKVKAGVIDNGYTGEVLVIMQNCGDYPQVIDVGTKVAQLVILPVPNIKIEEVKKLEKSERGEKGLGSTDNK